MPAREASGKPCPVDADVEDPEGGEALSHRGHLVPSLVVGQPRQSGQATAQAANAEKVFLRCFVVPADAFDAHPLPRDRDTPSAPLSSFELEGLVSPERGSGVSGRTPFHTKG